MSNTRLQSAVILLLALATCLGAAAGDRVVMADGKATTDLTATGLNAESLLVADGEPIPRAKLRRVERQAFAVPAMASAITLRDGSHLCGLIGKFGSGSIAFRSVSLGKLELPLAQVAAIRYRADTARAALPETPAAAGATVVRTDGGSVSGQVMWADAESVGLLTPDGLQRLETTQLVGLVIAPAVDPAGVALTLRNGDRLARITAAEGETLRVEFAGHSATLPWAAVQILNLNPEKKD